MARHRKGSSRLIDRVARLAIDPRSGARAISEGRVLVDGKPVTNPNSRIPSSAVVAFADEKVLRGSVKLCAALDHFCLGVDRRVALDVGASTGGFTTVLLERGASRVYAVDAGHGQLLGSLRQDPRVVNLEATNVADLTTANVPDQIGIITVDVSYLSLREAVRQVGRLAIRDDADLIGLVKPMFELKLATAPSDRASLDEALRLAVGGVESAGWSVEATMDSPVTGAKGSRELLIRARRVPSTG